ncbi:MAG: SpoIIE family protein phosphatase [Spirochaetales bacterium]|nr:SpoIIE family protein phosphatase [Spirochaetales bacterium]
MDLMLNDGMALAFLKESSTGFVLFDQHYNTLFVNKAIEKITGFSSQELIKGGFFDALGKNESYTKLGKEKLKIAMERPFEDFEFHITHKNSKKGILHLSGSSFNYNEFRYAVISCFDVTLKKEFEKVIESTYDNIMQSTIDLDAALKQIKEQRRALEDYKLKIQHELEVAKTVQKAIIPREFMDNELITVWGTSIPNMELGGDYFDFFLPDPMKLGVLIADVSGHGVPSALITTMVKVHFEKYANDLVETDQVIYHINKEVTKTLQETGFYFTAFYSIIDLDCMTISSTCAGHDFAICINTESGEINQLGKTEIGTIIGTFEEAEYDSSSFQLKENDILVYFTDGITESRNKEGKFYGLEGVTNILKANKDEHPKELIRLLIEDIDRFTEGVGVKDDRTVVMVKIKMVPSADNITDEDIRALVDSAFRNGRQYVKEKQYRAAVNEFLKVLRFDPKSSGAYSYLGQVFSLFGDYKKSEEYFNKAIELNENYVQGYYFLGIILYKQKKFQQAKEIWLKLKSIAGEFKNVNEYIGKLEKMGI